MHEIKNITITPGTLKLIAEIDEFKGRWTVIETLAPEKLTSLRRIATIESVGSSTRIEGARLNDGEVEMLLFGLRSESFAARDLRKSKARKTLDANNRMATAHGKNVRSIGEDGFDSSAQCQPEVSPVAIYYHFKAFPQASCCAPGDGSQSVSIRER